jgi:F-type H+-transporting ATPase subunit epsilon
MAKNENSILFKIVTPERTVVEEEVYQVEIPTKEGQITVLPKHESLISVVEVGEAKYKKVNGEFNYMVVADGFLEVDQNVVRVFAETAQKAEELDEAEILKAKERAEEAIKAKQAKVDTSFIDAEVNLKRELAKLKVLKNYKKRK